MNHHRTVGVLGATSLVGVPLLPLLAAANWKTVACSRAKRAPLGPAAANVVWCRPAAPRPGGEGVIATWIALCPLWAVPGHLEWLQSLGIRRLVALSSTSLETKRESPDPEERRLAAALAAAERTLRARAAAGGVDLCLLRPTMIYDGSRDGNVAAIAAFVRRHGWFPVAGPARGLRQPVHAADVAAACVAAIDRESLAAAYTLSGGEALPFRDLVEAVFAACGRPPRIMHVPRPLWTILVPLARTLGIAGKVSTGMAARMNVDLACNHADAGRDLGFRPRPFALDRLGIEARSP